MTWCSSILSISSTFSISDFGHGRLFSKLFLSTTIFPFLINFSFCDSSLFCSVFLALSPMSSLRCRFGCSLLLLCFVSKTLRTLCDIWWNTETASRLWSLWRIFCRWNFLFIVKKEGFLQSPLSRCVLKSIKYFYFASAHIQKNQLTNTGNDAFDFLGKRVFSEKNNDAIKSFSIDKNKAAISKDRGHTFAIQRMKEKERFSFRFLTDFS